MPDTAGLWKLGVEVWFFDSVGIENCVTFAWCFCVLELLSERWVLFKGLHQGIKTD